MESNTGTRSPGEELMTCNTSAVAVCCSRASRVSELSAKRLQLLKEASPAILHVAALRNPAGPKPIRRATEEAAGTVGVDLSTIEVGL